MAIGSITVDLLAKTGSFETDLNRAAKLSEQRAKDIEKSFIGMGAAVATGVAAAGAALVAIGNESIDQLAKLDDMTQKTGASVERLSQIQQTATAFGQDFNEVDSAISRLAKGMATVDSETNKTQKALAALGLTARDTSGALRDPADLLVDVARALQGYEDGASKAALATDLFGKAGANLLPFLNDLSENVDKFQGVTGQAAAQAAEFQDRLNRMKAEFQALAQSVTADVLPVLNRFLETINTIRKTSLTGFLLSSGEETDNPGRRLAEINQQLDRIASKRAELEALPAFTRKLNDAVWGDTADLDRRERLLNNQKQYLQGVQQLQALANKGAPDQVERAVAGGRMVLDYTTGNAPKTPKDPKGPKSQYEKDVEAAKKLIESLRTQAATFGQSEAEAVKYKLTLQGLPQVIIDTATALQQQVSDMKLADQVTKSLEDQFERQTQMYAQAAEQIAASLMTQEQLENESYNRRIEALKEYGKQSEAANAEANMLIEAENVRHQQAMSDMQMAYELDSIARTAGTFDALYQLMVQSGQEQSALGKAAFLASKALAVAEILMQTEVAAAKAVGQLGIFGLPASAVIRANGYAQAGLVAGMAIAGQRANGGPVEAGKQYIVGERGREAFIPTANGMIVPNEVLERGGSGEKLTIVNNTAGRIDNAHVRRISADEKAIILDEAISAVANDMSNPNSRTSRAQQRNFNVQRSRV